jgi:hypothetical protein
MKPSNRKGPVKKTLAVAEPAKYPEVEGMPIRNMMMPEEWYQKLDPGIRFAVRALHAAGGIETCQSCQGGEGHAYDRPTIDLIATADDAKGFEALSALQGHKLPVQDISLLWNISQTGLPYERLWRITFWRSMEDQADDQPMFIHCYHYNLRKND